MKKTLLLLLLASFAVFANAGNDGGGGIVITDNGKLETLAEAGYYFEADFPIGATGSFDTYYNLSDELKAEVENIVSKLPLPHTLKNQLISRTLQKVGTFIKGTKVHQREYRDIKRLYSRLFKKTGRRIKLKSFELAAYSTREKTYIFPLFNLLSLRQQALILIHETSMRYSDMDIDSLDRILTFDTAIYKWLEDQNSNSESDNLAMALSLIKAGDLGLYDAYEHVILARLIKHIQDETNEPLYLSNFEESTSKDDMDLTFIGGHIFNYFPQIDSRVASLLNGVSAGVWNTNETSICNMWHECRQGSPTYHRAFGDKKRVEAICLSYTPTPEKTFLYVDDLDQKILGLVNCEKMDYYQVNSGNAAEVFETLKTVAIEKR